LGSKNGATDYTSNATEADQGSGAERTLPLAPYIVCLVGQNGWDICICAYGSKEYAEITDAVV
jgi:hypothetical protein